MKTITFNKQTKLDFLANEAFKALRTNITFCGDDRKVILFTSSVPNEGKSSVVFQLVKSFAEDGKTILLLDADIRKSVLLGHYRVGKEARGLSHYLSGQENMENIIYHTNIDNFDIIFAGPVAPNPAELLGGRKFKELVERQRENYDYIMIDTPPLGSVIDAAIIAGVCDGSVIVVESGATGYKLAQHVKGQLEVSGCPILGAVLNKVDAENRGYYNYHYYSKNGKYGCGYGEKPSEKDSVPNQ